VLYQDIADQNRFRTSLTVSAARLSRALEKQRVMSHKLQFIEKAGARGANIAALCKEYGISRQTGHKWRRRFRAQGYTGLVEQSRRPISSPLATGEEIVVRVLELRDQH
jgi:putative transposase